MAKEPFLESDQLGVQFAKHEDRYAHRLIRLRTEPSEIDSANERTEHSLVVESVEGDASEDWPSTAPMQQVVAEQIGRDNASVLLGVGLSGNGHWSLAVDESHSGGQASLRFDYACKISRGAGFLGTRYRWGETISECELEGSLVTIRIRNSPEETPTVICLRVEVGRLSVDPVTRSILICPDSDIAKPGTHRWCYRFSSDSVR